jgi:hypothetical protein
MRGLRPFLALLVLAAGLGWWAYRDSKRAPGSDTPKHDKVFTVDADKIDEVTIKSENGDRTTLRKKGADWEIVQPVATRSDAAEISGITSNLAGLEIQRVIDESPADLKEYGLAEPRIDISFKSGGQEHRLLIGQKTPPGSDLYAKFPDQKKVFLIPSYLESTFNKSTFDLRDKSVLKVEQEKIDSLEITAGGATKQFLKTGGEWQIAQPPDGRADYGMVDALVGRVASAQMKALTAAEPPSLKEYGLDTPAESVRIGTGSSQALLLFGSAAGEGAVYAKDAARPAVFTIDASLVDDLKKDAGEYRQKDLFDARTFNATRIEVTREGKTVAFEKTQAKTQNGNVDKWKQVLPTARDVDNAKVDALVSAATSARALGFVASTDKTNLDKPELTVAITTDPGKVERVSFAHSGADSYAGRAGTPGAATVDSTTIDAIVKALEDIK